MKGTIALLALVSFITGLAFAAEKTAPKPQDWPEVAKAGNRTPEDLAETILDCLRKQDFDGLATRALFSDEDAKAMVRRLKEALGPAGEDLPPPFQRGIESWDGEDFREDWARFAKSDLGIDWSRAKLERVECQIAMANGIVGASGIDIIFSAGDDRRYRLFVDDCYLTDRGWLAADDPSWKGVVPPRSATREEVDALLASLKEDDPSVRKEAVEELGRLAVKRAVQPLTGLLDDLGEDLRRAVIAALGDIGDPAATKSLRPFLESSDRLIRLAAARSLGQLQWQPAPGRDRVLYHLAKEAWKDALKAAPSVHRAGANAVEIGVPISDSLFVLPLDLCLTRAADAAEDAGQRPDILGFPWVDFQPAKRGKGMCLHVQYDSWPKARWAAKLGVLDARGKMLAEFERTFENSGTVGKYASWEETVVRFDDADKLESLEELGPKALRFSLELAQSEDVGGPTEEMGASAGQRRPETGPERGTFLFIRTKPNGAKVLIDGKYVGFSDNLFPVDPGVRRIVVELEGHDPNSRNATIRAGRIERVKLELTKRSASSPQASAGEAGAATKVFLPNADDPRCLPILDLATGDILTCKSKTEVAQLARKGKGDVFVYPGRLGCLRGAQPRWFNGVRYVELPVSDQDEHAILHKLLAVPCRLQITTAEGNLFDLTISSATEKGTHIECRRTGKKVPGVTRTQRPAGSPQSRLSFGPVTEKKLLDRRSAEDCYIDFDTGKLFGKPRPDDKSVDRIDAGASLQTDTAALLSLGMSVFPVDDGLWDDGFPLGILEKTVSGKPGKPIMEARGNSARTYLFKTSEGAVGILQVLGVTDDEPDGIRIRYKLVVETPADAKVQAAQ